MKKITIYTDGACSGNPGPGGWGAVLRYGEKCREISGGQNPTTNNQMEMLAVIEALKSLKHACEVDLYTDSQYVRQGITEWVAKWKRNGWKTADKKPVKNQELWQQMDDLTQNHKIHWHWVKGHSGNPDNERADELARGAINLTTP